MQRLPPLFWRSSRSPLVSKVPAKNAVQLRHIMPNLPEAIASEQTREPSLPAVWHSDESPLAFARRLIRETQFTQAIQVCRAALKSGDPNAELQETLGRALLLSGDAKAALWHLLQATVLAPTKDSAFVCLGIAYNQLEQPSRAIEVLTKAVKLRASASSYFHLGVAHRQLGNLAQAKSQLREALRLNPSLADAHCQLAGVFQELADHSRSVMHYQIALQLRPRYPDAVQGLNKATRALSDREADTPTSTKEPSAVTQTPLLHQPIPQSPMSVDPLRARFLGRDIAATANDLRQHFDNTIVPLLSKLHRLVIEGRATAESFRSLFREYRSACQHNSELRKILRQQLVCLFAADELAQARS